MTLLKPMTVRELARCEMWKDEVQNLLIFVSKWFNPLNSLPDWFNLKAGLFSAVVTAFLIESYKTLRQDPINTSVILLSRILAQLENTPQTNTTIPAFTPSPHDIRISVFWSLSLIFSLATVLVGIVSLQWLREYQRTRDDIAPQLSFSLHSMHSEAIDRWYLPQIFTALPLLLQVGLIFFFIGVGDFLLQLHPAAAIPVIIAIGLTLLFLIITTILPTVQALTLFLPRQSTTPRPRAQCPYKSPQSWAFHQSVAFIVQLYAKVFPGERLRFQLNTHEVVCDDERRPWGYFPLATDTIFRRKHGDSWFDHGISWLYQRDRDLIQALVLNNANQGVSVGAELLDARFLSDIPSPIFDAVSKLAEAKRSSHSWHEDLTVIHNCFDQITAFKPRNNAAFPAQRLGYFEYMQSLLQFMMNGNLKIAPLHLRPHEKITLKDNTRVLLPILMTGNPGISTSQRKPWQSNLLEDYTQLLFHSLQPIMPNGSPVNKRIVEVVIRLTEDMFANGGINSKTWTSGGVGRILKVLEEYESPKMEGCNSPSALAFWRCTD